MRHPMGRVAGPRGGVRASQMDRGVARARARRGRRRVHRRRRRPWPGPALVDRSGLQGQPDLRRLGQQGRDRRLPGRRRHLQRLQRRGHRQDQGLRHPRRPEGGARQRARCPTSSWSAAATSPTSRTRSSTSRSATCSTTATSTSVTATRGRRSRRSPVTASSSACPTASRRWSSTTTPSSSTSRRWPSSGLDVPTVDDEDLSKKPTWTLEQFQAAAEYASRPRRGIAGFYIAPTLRGLAPFIYSGGGNVFDNDDEPTSLAFSSDDTKSALEKVLPVLRDPKLSLHAGDARPRRRPWSGSARAGWG